jgi:hypothetical protein
MGQEEVVAWALLICFSAVAFLLLLRLLQNLASLLPQFLVTVVVYASLTYLLWYTGFYGNTRTRNNLAVNRHEIPRWQWEVWAMQQHHQPPPQQPSHQYPARPMYQPAHYPPTITILQDPEEQQETAPMLPVFPSGISSSVSDALTSMGTIVVDTWQIVQGIWSENKTPPSTSPTQEL